MWNWPSWLHRNAPQEAPRDAHAPPASDPAEPSAGDGPIRLDRLQEQMSAQGYLGPIANLRDGLWVVVFQSPEVPQQPAWMEPADNQFAMRVLNCEAFCRLSAVFATGKEGVSIARRFEEARAGSDQFFRPRAIPDARRDPCLLGYPTEGLRGPDGARFVATATEELWHVFMFEKHLFFLRSWTGELLYRAKLSFRHGAMFVTEVETSSKARAAGQPPNLADDGLPVRQVDFLIKTLLYRLPAPAPLPRGLCDRPGGIAWYSLMEYGSHGGYPTFEDTTEFRLCLNGVAGRFRPSPENALLPWIEAVEESDDSTTRQKLLQQLRGSRLYLSLSVPEEALRNAITADTPCQIFQHQWRGEPCVFAYTDPAFRIEPSHGCVCIEAAKLWDAVGEEAGFGMVINPAGPATCLLSPAELKALAS